METTGSSTSRDRAGRAGSPAATRVPLAPLPPGTRWGAFGTTADVGLWARSTNPDGLFSGLGTGLFGIMTDLRAVEPRGSCAVAARSGDLPGLVVSFLSELVRLEDTEGFVARRVHARLDAGATSVRAEAVGEPWDPERHPRKVDVKAVTMHRLAISLDPPRARVILDI